MTSQELASFNLGLKFAILASGRTQRQIARRCRIDETRLSRIIRRQVSPFPRERRRLAKELRRLEAELFPPAEAA